MVMVLFSIRGLVVVMYVAQKRDFYHVWHGFSKAKTWPPGSGFGKAMELPIAPHIPCSRPLVDMCPVTGSLTLLGHF